MLAPTSQLILFYRSVAKDDFISLLVEDHTYNIQRSLLTTASPYFAKALDSRFREGEERIIRFTDTPRAIVENLIFFLFYHTIQFGDFEEKADGDYHLVDYDPNEELAIRLWIFGDKYLLPTLQNMAMRHLHKCLSKRHLEARMLREVLEGTVPGSALRDLALTDLVYGLHLWTDKHGSRGNVGYDPALLHYHNADFIKELTAKLLSIPKPKDGKYGWYRNGVKAFLVPEEVEKEDRDGKNNGTEATVNVGEIPGDRA